MTDKKGKLIQPIKDGGCVIMKIPSILKKSTYLTHCLIVKKFKFRKLNRKIGTITEV